MLGDVDLVILLLLVLLIKFINIIINKYYKLTLLLIYIINIHVHVISFTNLYFIVVF